MALFKILSGDSSRIDPVTTPLHEGWMYVTTDNAKMYVDMQVDGVLRRVCLNPSVDSTVSVASASATLAADGWINGAQTVVIDGLTADTDGVVGLAQTATDTQREAAEDAGLTVTAQGDGTLTITAAENMPTVDIPVYLMMFG